MRRPSRAVSTQLATLATAVCLMIAAIPGGPATAQDDNGPFCAILTADQVSAALGLTVSVGYGLSTDCSYQSDSAAFETSLDSGTLDDVRAGGDYKDVTVADKPGLVSLDGTRLSIQLDDGILTFTMLGDVGPGVDAATALEALGALAIASLAATPLASPTPAPALSAFCAILTLAEVSAEFKIPVTFGMSGDNSCIYDADDGYSSVDLLLGEGKLADFLAARGDYQAVTVAGLPALILPDATSLVIQTDQGILTMYFTDYGNHTGDDRAALLALGAIAVGRLPSIATGS